MRAQYDFRKDCAMKGYASKLCNIDSIEIPAELLATHIDTQLIEEEMNALSLRYAEESPAPCAAAGDVVHCRADATDYPDGRTILLFTAAALPGAETAAQAALGKAAGDTFKTELAGKPVTLTVEKIIRRTPVTVDDALIAAMGIDGVSTVEGYRAYLTEKAWADARLEQSKVVMRYLVDELLSRSEFVYDEAEMAEQIEKARAECAAMPAEYALSEEELSQSVMNQCKQEWAAQAYCRQVGFTPDEDEVKQQAQQMEQMMELMGENVPSEEELLDMARTDACLTPLYMHINDIITQKIGG